MVNTSFTHGRPKVVRVEVRRARANRPEYQSDLFKKGLEVRRDVLGADYVDGSLDPRR